jgi:hypothetical protein
MARQELSRFQSSFLRKCQEHRAILVQYLSPGEHLPAHEHSPQVARRRRVDSTVKPVGGSGGGAAAAAAGGACAASRGSAQQVACSKATRASSQLVGHSRGSHVSLDASLPAQSSTHRVRLAGADGRSASGF